MFFHDSVTDTQAEAGAFSDLFSSKEWIEDAVGLADSRPVIAECDLNEVSTGRG